MSSLLVRTKLTFPDKYFIILDALIDSGVTTCIIHEKFVPRKYWKQTSQPTYSQQMDGSYINDVGSLYITKDYSIQTKGYEDFAEENLLICIGFIGRCTNTSSTKFKKSL